MAGGTKRLPRAVREQQMLDAAVEMFSVNGYHDTSMDAIAAKAEISKPMLYLLLRLERGVVRRVSGPRAGALHRRCARGHQSRAEPETSAAQTPSWRSCVTSTPTVRPGL